MKILYVDLLYDYGIKSRGVNAIGQDGFKQSFERLGHQVSTFYYDDYLKDIPALQTAVRECADSIKPDLIFFCLFRDQFSISTLQYLKSKYTTINWFGDDQWRFDSFTRVYAPCFSWCVTTDKFSIPKYHRIGQNNVIYSQWAAINEHEVPSGARSYAHDVSFVGAYHPYRQWFINQLVAQGISVSAFGHGWPQGALSSQQMSELFVRSKINLNISNSTSFSFSYLFSSLRAFLTALKSRKASSQIKARNFEIPYFGGFQLTDYVPTLESYLQIGSEVCCYSSVEEAALLIRYYLEQENESEREAIRVAGHQRALQQHGYIHRIEQVIRTVS